MEICCPTQLEDRNIPSKRLRVDYCELGAFALEILSQVHFPPRLNDPNRLTGFQRDGLQQLIPLRNKILGGEYVEVGTGGEELVSIASKLFKASNWCGK